jgi:phosphoribosylanthranilate isomerase
MIAGIRVKVCGLRSLVDAEAADEVGADYLGFILYPKSPRCISLEQFRSLLSRLPPRQKVAVTVEPQPEELGEWLAAGFDQIQVHFRPETPVATVAAWAAVAPGKLWLAPKIPAGTAWREEWLSAADTMLFDTYHAAGFGGSGQTGDWSDYACCRSKHPGHHWILAGGLGPENVARALAVSGTRWIDVNSGVESAPGVKDAAKIRQLAASIRQHASGGNAPPV